MESEANIQLSPEDRARLEGWVAGRNTPQKLVWRARIVLMWAQGAGVTAIVRATGQDQADRLPLARSLSGARRRGARTRRHPSRPQAALTAATIERVVT